MREVPAIAITIALLGAFSPVQSQESDAPRVSMVAGVVTPAPARPITPDTTLLYRLDIPAEPLREALVALSRQTGLRVEAEAVASSARSRVVLGTLTAPAALRAMLDGSGYGARFLDAQSVMVERSSARDQTLVPVVVTAAARRSRYAPRRTLTATRTDIPLRDVPQAVTVLGRQLLADQSAQSMAEVVRYIPGITMGQGEGHRDAPTIRGNSTTADFFVDGVRDDAQYLRDIYNVEQVEALKGANAMVFGRGGGGGVINRVTRDAQWTPVHALTLEGGSFAHRRATLDIGDGLGGTVAGRLNGVLEESGHFRDATSLERRGLNPTAAVLLGKTLVRMGHESFSDRRTVNRGIPAFQGRPSSAELTTFFGDPAASPSTTVVNASSAAVERSVGAITIRNRTRFAVYDKFYQNVYPGAVNAAGTDVSLLAYNNATWRRNLLNQTDVTWSVERGRVRQIFLVGAEVGRQTTDNYRETGYFGDSATSLAVPFDQPQVSTPVTFRQSATDPDYRAVAGSGGIYGQHQIALGSRWQAVVGLRYERFELQFQNHRNGQQLFREDLMLSPRAGIVFRPAEPVSVYSAYSVSHLPGSGDQFSSLSATTQALDPERFINREVGLKWELRPNLAVNAAVYRLDRTNTSAPSPLDPARIVQTGRQRTTGEEIDIIGNISAAWEVAGGYAGQRALIMSRTTAAKAGASAPLVPRHTFSLWNRYRIATRLSTGLGVVAQSRMFAAVDNSVTLPGFARLDAAAYLTVMRSVRAQLNVENVLGHRYYGTSHGNNNIMPGAPRTLRISVTATP